jgi:hypothetical protein
MQKAEYMAKRKMLFHPDYVREKIRANHGRRVQG